jgi:hypothetical protein
MFRNYLLGSLLASMSALGMVTQTPETPQPKKENFVQFKMPPNPMDDVELPTASVPPQWLQKLQEQSEKIDEAAKIFEESKKELTEILKQKPTTTGGVSEARLREILREELNNFKPKAYSTTSGGGGSSGTYTPAATYSTYSTYSTTTSGGGSSGTSTVVTYPSATVSASVVRTRPALLPWNRTTTVVPRANVASGTCRVVNGVMVCN